MPPFSSAAASPVAAAIIAADGVKIASYDFGAPEKAPVDGSEPPTVLAVHGFSSSGLANFQATGWVRDLGRAGFRVIAIDQRGHGESDKPHNPDSYTMRALVDDVLTVLDTYMLDEVHYVGYSLGARVGWQFAREYPDRVRRAVFGGIPDGVPLTRFRVDKARDHLNLGTAVDDRVTEAYLSLAASIPSNDIEALICVVEGMREGPGPTPDNTPPQPLLVATGSEDGIIGGSRALAAAAPQGTFFEIPGRNHFNAPTSRAFRDAAIAFLSADGGEQPA